MSLLDLVPAQPILRLFLFTAWGLVVIGYLFFVLRLVLRIWRWYRRRKEQIQATEVPEASGLEAMSSLVDHLEGVSFSWPSLLRMPELPADGSPGTPSPSCDATPHT